MNQVNPKKPSNKLAQMLGRYRVILIAVAFFLVFDLGVLVLNFYTSFKISEDALSVNLSGRQRMLSQRMTKAILTVQADRLASARDSAAVDELRSAAALFDGTFKAFKEGGTVTGGDGKPVMLKAAEGERAGKAISEAEAIWGEYKTRVDRIVSGQLSAEELNEAVVFARSNNVRLLTLMNDLTTALETRASARAQTLRMVQTIGIILALLNFIYILYKFLGSLRKSDVALAQANEENQDILLSVQEGLFLVERDMSLGTQLSRSVSKLLGTEVKPGDNLLDVLKPLVSAKTLEEAREYLDVLFQPHVKDALVQSLNPLSEMQVAAPDLIDKGAKRYLSVRFNRVIEGGEVKHLLVTMQDVTPTVQLQGKLDAERTRSQAEFSMLLRAFQADASTLNGFLKDSRVGLLRVNELLRGAQGISSPQELRQTVDEAFRIVHRIKGEAQALELTALAQNAHVFESELALQRDQPDRPGGMLSLVVPLEDLLSKVQAIEAMSEARSSSGPAAPATLHAPQVNGSHPAVSQLQQLVTQIERDTGKRCGASVRWDVASVSENVQRTLGDIAIQLVRNAAVHGIEPSPARGASGKSPEGHIDVRLGANEQGQTELSVRDDGAGLVVGRIKERLAKLGWFNPQELTAMSDQQAVAQIFKPGFSTEAEVTPHAGRGVGLDAVNAWIKEIGAKLHISSQPGLFTEFRVVLTKYTA